MFYKIQKNEHEGANFFSTKMTEFENLGVFGLTLITEYKAYRCYNDSKYRVAMTVSIASCYR
jgi:hypothetical protein